MLISRFKRVALAGTMLTVVSLTGGCSGIDRLSQIGEQPELLGHRKPDDAAGLQAGADADAEARGGVL